MTTSAASSPSVLVVDDDADIREAIAELLEDHGYQVVLAAHGAEALELLVSGRVQPRVMLLDLMMPVMDGWRLMAELRARGGTLSLPKVVVFSAYRGPGEGDTSLAVEQLKKPVTSTVLLDALARHAG